MFFSKFGRCLNVLWNRQVFGQKQEVASFLNSCIEEVELERLERGVDLDLWIPVCNKARRRLKMPEASTGLVVSCY